MPTEITIPQAAEYAKAFLTQPVIRSDQDPNAQGQGQFVGGLTIRGLEYYLELQGVKKGSERRTLATTTVGLLKDGQLNQEVFAGQYGMGVRFGNPEELGTAFVHRTDLSTQEAITRYIEHEASLKQQVEEQRAKKAEEDSKKSQVIDSKKQKDKNKKRTSKEGRAAEVKSSPIERVAIIEYQGVLTPEFRQDFYLKLREQISDSEEVRDIGDLTAGVKDPALRLLHSTDIKSIVERGITQQQLKGLLPKLRQEFLKTAKDVSSKADDVAQQVLAKIDEVTIPGRSEPEVITYVQEFLMPLVYRSMAEQTSTDVTETMAKLESTADPYNPPCIYHDMLDLWDGRFDPKTWNGYRDALAISTNPLAPRLVELYETQPSLFDQLKKQGQVEFAGKIIRLKDVDNLIADIVITDEMLTRGIFNDVICAIYPNPLLVEGDYQEGGLRALRILESKFPIDEIVSLITPGVANPADYQRQVTDLRANIVAQESELSRLQLSLFATPDAVRTLQVRISNLKIQFTGLVNKGPKGESVTERVQKALASIGDGRGMKPNPDDYEGGEESLEYKKEFFTREAFGFLKTWFPNAAREPKQGSLVTKRLL